MRKLISFLIPTNRDPKYCLNVIDNIEKVWADFEKEILVCSPQKIALPTCAKWIKDESKQKGWVWAVNQMYKLSRGDYIILSIDDHLYPPDAPAILDLLEQQASKIISFTGDGGQVVNLPPYCPPWPILRFPVFAREAVEKLLGGYILHPKFRHHYSDNWLGFYLGSKGFVGVEVDYLAMKKIREDNCRCDEDKWDEMLFKKLVEGYKEGDSYNKHIEITETRNEDVIKFGELRINSISKRHIQECLDSNNITMGVKVRLFEEKWRNIFGYKHARLMASGTAAGTAACMALYSLGAKPGDEIICPALSFIATANAIRMANFVPKFVDVRRETLNIDEDKIEAAITDKTVAIKVVNTMGRPCQLDFIQDIAKKHNLFVIVDGCESYGCKYKNKFALDFADMETSSHYAAHCIISGEGGCVSTNDTTIDAFLESVRSHGRRGGSLYFDHEDFGGNFKNTDLHASIGLGELEVFWENFNLRHQNMMMLHDGLSSYKDKFWASEQDTDCINCPHGFSITLKDPRLDIEGLKVCLKKANIDFKRNFGCTPTQHAAFKYLGYKEGDFPEAEYVGSYGLHFGVHRYLTSSDIDCIVNVVGDYFKKGNK